MRAGAFILVAITFSATAVFSAGAGGIAAGPMFTPVSTNEVSVWFQTDVPTTADVGVYTIDADEQLVRRHTIETQAVNRCIGTFLIDTDPGRHYLVRLRFSDASGTNGTAAVEGGFVAPPEAGMPGAVRIAFGSCAHQDRYPRQPVFRAIAEKRPDLFLMLGDNIYLPSDVRAYPTSESAVRELYYRHYDRGRRIADLQPLLRTTLTCAIWDDHDFGPENCGASWLWHDLAREVFHLYFPGETGTADLPGCFRRLRFGDVEVFLLDDRTYRAPATGDQPATLLGRRQFDWLLGGLKASSATIKVVACGSQILADYHHGESWGVDAREERDKLLDAIQRRPIAGVVFISGDRHFAELLVKRDPAGRGNDLYDLTSSPLANRNADWAMWLKSPDRLDMYVGGPNFGLLEIDAAAEPPRVALGVYDQTGRPVIARTITLPNASAGAHEK